MTRFIHDQFAKQYLKELLPQVREEVEKQTKRNMIEMLLRSRFETIDEELAKIIEPILKLPLQEFVPLLVQLSREELLTRFAEK
ncbi:MAG: hypothetical protein AB4290_26275 [Spirulina sp.]